MKKEGLVENRRERTKKEDLPENRGERMKKEDLPENRGEWMKKEGRLEQKLGDMIEEQQAKLGYLRETVRLYYPLSSLNRILGTSFDALEMEDSLERFREFVRERLGRIEISRQGERFCFQLPPEASEYIHKTRKQSGFLYDFVEAVSCHGAELEDVLAVFERYSDCVRVQRMEGGEVDYLVWFEDGRPDDYRYCLTQEGEHLTYHRFAPEDYEGTFLAE